MNGKVKLLVVDDSLLYRSQIQLALKDHPLIEIVGSASNGQLALQRLKSGPVDLCLMDIEMPELDGLSTLKEIKALGLKTKVIMFSSQGRASAEKTMQALCLGAVDFVAKPDADGSSVTPAEKIRQALVPKIESLFSLPVRPTSAATVRTKFLWETFIPEALVIASSTGGPTALEEFFKTLRGPLPFPILIAQHMPPVFTASLAAALGKASGLVAKEAIHGEELKAGEVYVAPGNFHLRVGKENGKIIALLDQTEPRNFVRPAADHLFESAAKVYGRRLLGVVLTGMGRDGADGAAALKAVGAPVMIQNQESCVVFGMPGAVFEAGHFDYQGTPQELALKVSDLAQRLRRNHVA